MKFVRTVPETNFSFEDLFNIYIYKPIVIVEEEVITEEEVIDPNQLDL